VCGEREDSDAHYIICESEPSDAIELAFIRKRLDVEKSIYEDNSCHMVCAKYQVACAS
jgi:hypothetical protein